MAFIIFFLALILFSLLFYLVLFSTFGVIEFAAKIQDNTYKTINKRKIRRYQKRLEKLLKEYRCEHTGECDK